MAEITYNIYRDSVMIADGIEGNTYTDTELDPNTTYSYQVSAVNEYGESELSEAVTVTTDYSAVSSISLNKTETTINLGDSETLDVTVSPATANQEVEWTSDDEDVATVSNGVVQAVGVGEAIITATSVTDSGQATTCNVTVVDEGDAPDGVEGLQSTGNTDTTVDLEWNQ